jgi:hypothetical protein
MVNWAKEQRPTFVDRRLLQSLTDQDVEELSDFIESNEVYIDDKDWTGNIQDLAIGYAIGLRVKNERGLSGSADDKAELRTDDSEPPVDVKQDSLPTWQDRVEVLYNRERLSKGIARLLDGRYNG